MSSNIQIINPIEYPGWDDLIYQHEGDGSIFHTSAWAKILCESYNYRPLYFTVFENKRISALVPVMEVDSPITGKRGVSLPFTDYCEPIITGGSYFPVLLDHIINHGKIKGWKYLELRGAQTRLHDQISSTFFYGHTLDLSADEKKLFARFRKSTQRNIKKAEKEGIIVHFSHSLEATKEFYRLNCLTRKEHGLPPQPMHFFKKAHDNLISKNKGVIALASYKEKYIAGAVFLHNAGKALYKYGASDRYYQQFRANNLIMWEAIRHYCTNGYREFCFGRTEPENHGLRQFKTGWGVNEHLIRYYKYDMRSETFVKDKQKVKPLYNKLFSIMPIPLLKAAGNLLYKHMG